MAADGLARGPGEQLAEAVEPDPAARQGRRGRGAPGGLEASVRDMWALEYQAVALMHVPLGDDGETAGPPFTPPA